MIWLKRLDGSPFVINADLIELVEATPDTVVSLHTGRRYIVKESVDEVIAKVIAYKRSLSADIANCS